ncbi:MAG: protein kinase [Acidobacteriota bacterium]|nr:protein kinase [Acidobacteriota bacterium]MDQ5871017.1 protein kinase [Acidobacteriota bacterium]
MTLSPGTRLGPYEILAPIGAGGMGEVYRARDKKLDRDVAIKVLPESVAADPDTLARFEREAKAVAALSHPNILSIFDFGTHEGISYAVSELLEGETLREKLVAGPIREKQAVDYALQTAKGLSAAHDRGVVHRDLKPENLFVTRDGRLKILDFGLAKKVGAVVPGEETNAPTVSKHTEPGTVMGTVGYMSPEQVRGLPVDHRSDIFSFGAILYELLSGKRAFSRHTVSDTMAAVMRDEPPELSESGRNISPALDHIVRHCLEKDRDSRFHSAHDIAFALSEQSSPTATSGAQFAAPPTGRRKVLIAAVAIVVLAVAVVFLLRRPHRTVSEIGGVKRVAVLPFENLGSPEDDYFADGIADAVRGKLTSLPGVEVIARASSTPYKKTTKTPEQIARELQARYLLTATVRWQKSGGTSRVQVSPELVEVRESVATASRWQQPFVAALTDVFQVQSDIASRVAQALGVTLGAGEEKQLSEKPTQNLAAYDAFLKGERAAIGSNPLSQRKALGFYEQAVALDPGFAQAWAQVSKANSGLYILSGATPELAERARQAAEKAVALAPDRPDGYLARGTYQRVVVGDSNRALEEYAKGQRITPANADLLGGIASAELSLGRWQAAVEHLRQAERLDPRSVNSPQTLGWALVQLRRYIEAREACDRALALAPANLWSLQFKAITFLGEGDLAGARAVLKTALKELEPTTLVAFMATYLDLVWVLDEEEREVLLRLTPGAFDDNKNTWGLCLAQASALKGDAASVRTYAEEARKAAAQLVRATPDDAPFRAELGLSLAYLGRKEEAIREGKRAVALQPVAKDAFSGAYFQHQLARIYMLVGEPEKALDKLELLLKIPYVLSPGWLEIDPNFDPLRKNPRFQKLVAGAK